MKSTGKAWLSTLPIRFGYREDFLHYNLIQVGEKKSAGILGRLADRYGNYPINFLEGELIDSGTRDKLAGKVRVDYRRCHYCGACVAVCPPEAIFLWNSVLVIRIDKCTACERCLPVCPVNALEIVPAGNEVEE